MKFTPAKPITSDPTLGRGMELALVTLVFLGLGYGFDRWFGTQPVFIIAFVLLALVGQFAKMYYEYDATMRIHEQQRSEAASPSSRGTIR